MKKIQPEEPGIFVNVPPTSDGTPQVAPNNTIASVPPLADDPGIDSTYGLDSAAASTVDNHSGMTGPREGGPLASSPRLTRRHFTTDLSGNGDGQSVRYLEQLKYYLLAQYIYSVKLPESVLSSKLEWAVGTFTKADWDEVAINRASLARCGWPGCGLEAPKARTRAAQHFILKHPEYDPDAVESICSTNCIERFFQFRLRLPAIRPTSLDGVSPGLMADYDKARKADDMGDEKKEASKKKKKPVADDVEEDDVDPDDFFGPATIPEYRTDEKRDVETWALMGSRAANASAAEQSRLSNKLTDLTSEDVTPFSRPYRQKTAPIVQQENRWTGSETKRFMLQEDSMDTCREGESSPDASWSEISHATVIGDSPVGRRISLNSRGDSLNRKSPIRRSSEAAYPSPIRMAATPEYPARREQFESPGPHVSTEPRLLYMSSELTSPPSKPRRSSQGDMGRRSPESTSTWTRTQRSRDGKSSTYTDSQMFEFRARSKSDAGNSGERKIEKDADDSPWHERHGHQIVGPIGAENASEEKALRRCRASATPVCRKSRLPPEELGVAHNGTQHPTKQPASVQRQDAGNNESSSETQRTLRRKSAPEIASSSHTRRRGLTHETTIPASREDSQQVHKGDSAPTSSSRRRRNTDAWIPDRSNSEDHHSGSVPRSWDEQAGPRSRAESRESHTQLRSILKSSSSSGAWDPHSSIGGTKRITFSQQVRNDQTPTSSEETNSESSQSNSPRPFAKTRSQRDQDACRRTSRLKGLRSRSVTSPGSGASSIGHSDVGRQTSINEPSAPIGYHRGTDIEPPGPIQYFASLDEAADLQYLPSDEDDSSYSTEEHQGTTSNSKESIQGPIRKDPAPSPNAGCFAEQAVDEFHNFVPRRWRKKGIAWRVQTLLVSWVTSATSQFLMGNVTVDPPWRMSPSQGRGAGSEESTAGSEGDGEDEMENYNPLLDATMGIEQQSIAMQRCQALSQILVSLMDTSPAHCGPPEPSIRAPRVTAHFVNNVAKLVATFRLDQRATRLTAAEARVMLAVIFLLMTDNSWQALSDDQRHSRAAIVTQWRAMCHDLVEVEAFILQAAGTVADLAEVRREWHLVADSIFGECDVAIVE